MGRKAKDKDRKKDLTKTKAWLMPLLPKLQEASLKDLTMDDLAEMIGKSKSTLYVYFKSKEELLIEMSNIKLRSLEDLRSQIDLSKGEVIELYSNYLTLFANSLGDISIHFLKEIKGLYPNIWALIEDLINRIMKDLKKLYEVGIREKKFKEVSLEWMLALDRFFVMEIITNAEIFPEKSLRLEKLIKEYLEIRLDGLKKIRN